MSIISYDELGRLRFKDFLSSEDETYVEESGVVVCVGLGGYEQFGENYFGWKQGQPYRIAEVTLDLLSGSKLSVQACDKILMRLGLPLCRGMTASKLIEIFGTPLSDKPGRQGLRMLSFVVGEPDKYILGCDVEEREGLAGLFLARKDYVDEDDSI